MYRTIERRIENRGKVNSKVGIILVLILAQCPTLFQRGRDTIKLEIEWKFSTVLFYFAPTGSRVSGRMRWSLRGDELWMSCCFVYWIRIDRRNALKSHPRARWRRRRRKLIRSKLPRLHWLPNYLNFLKPRKISRIEQHENDTWPKISWDCVEFLEKGASSFYFEALKRGLNL